MFLEELIRRKVKYVYLGKPGLAYKNHFDAEVFQRYSGKIYREEVVEHANLMLHSEKLNRIAVYGLGKVGKEFMQLAPKLNTTVIAGIDQSVQALGNLKVITPDQIQEIAPNLDAVIIALEKQNRDVEELLRHNGFKSIYYSDLIF